MPRRIFCRAVGGMIEAENEPAGDCRSGRLDSMCANYCVVLLRPVPLPRPLNVRTAFLPVIFEVPRVYGGKPFYDWKATRKTSDDEVAFFWAVAFI